MLAWFTSLLSGPIVKGVLDGYKANSDAGNTADRIAVDLATRELNVQRAEIEAQKQLRVAQAGQWYTPESLFGYIMVIYFERSCCGTRCWRWGRLTRSPALALNGPVSS